MAFSNVKKKVVWLRILLGKLSFPQVTVMIIHTNNTKTLLFMRCQIFGKLYTLLATHNLLIVMKLLWASSWKSKVY